MPGPVVPVGEDALARPAVPHHVVQADRLELGQRLALARRDVGLPDVGVGVEDVVVGGGDVHVAADDGRLGPAATTSRSAASQASLYS